jgi:23S rRNA (guanosine2251-2'-O)-methyltransferase
MKEWIAGRNPVYETLISHRRDFFRLLIASGVDEKGRLTEIIQLAEKYNLKAERVPRAQLDGIAENHQGVTLQTSSYPYAALTDILAKAEESGEPLLVLALDTIQNPQNLGTLLRTAEAAGVHGVLVPLRQTAGVTPVVVHTSAGASEHLLIAQANLAQGLTTLKQAGAWVVGLEGGPEARPIEDVNLNGPLVVVVGNEGDGMRSLVQKSCDFVVRLPMKGKIESLNAAVAGSIVLYRVLQAREKSTK